MYAAGKELDAMRRLEAAIKSNENLGDSTIRAWACLFELLQVLGRQPAFDALALTFARRFEKSPPAWNAATDDESVAAESSGGRAHVALGGVLNVGVGEVLKQAMKLAATSTLVRMDVSKLTDADNNGATLLMRGIAALKRAKKEFVFGSPEHLAGILEKKLVVGERSNQEMWLLLLELHQQAFHQEAFEEVAVNYAITFEVSPPSWEAPPARSEEAAKAADKSVPPPEGFALAGQMLGVGAANYTNLDAVLKSRDEYDIDARKLVRIDPAATHELHGVLNRFKGAGKRLRLVGLSTLIAVYLEARDFHDVVDLKPRAI